MFKLCAFQKYHFLRKKNPNGSILPAVLKLFNLCKIIFKDPSYRYKLLWDSKVENPNTVFKEKIQDHKLYNRQWSKAQGNQSKQRQTNPEGKTGTGKTGHRQITKNRNMETRGNTHKSSVPHTRLSREWMWKPGYYKVS